MRIVFDDEALDDLRAIRAWIAKDNACAADGLIKRIFNRIENLLTPELTYGAARFGSRHT
jgi:plasmid stabilization system protein ParE